MTKFDNLKMLFATDTSQISISGFLIGLTLTGILSSILALFYRRYAQTFSNRLSFSQNFLLLSITTMIVITIVKSSLALSLGLVGALSIVRFRSAVKEPEELIYLFLAIAIGLGLGAGQILLTVVALTFSLAVIWFKSRFAKQDEQQSNLLALTIPNDGIDIDELSEILASESISVKLKRFEKGPKLIEASFVINLNDFDQLTKIMSKLTSKCPEGHFTFLDNREA